MKYRSITLVTAVLALCFGFTSIVSAQEPEPTSTNTPAESSTSSEPPVIPSNEPITANSPQLNTTATASTLSLPPLKAVIIVGSIDGSNGSWTNKEKANADLAANELAANGVTVQKFYTPNADWNQIKAAANGAHFLIYRGHGLLWNGTTVGGFGLDSGMYSSADIQANLKLAPNAIVMIYACYAAGGSSTDKTVISSADAVRRVGEYSKPFFDLGASAYYSDWYPDFFKAYVHSLFQGATLFDAYKAFEDYDGTHLITTTHPANPNIPLWISYDTLANYTPPSPQYDDVFAGQPNKTLQDLFGASGLQLSSQNVTYIAQPNFGAQTFQVIVSSNSSAPFNWTASTSPSGSSKPGWLNFSGTGTKGSPINITINPQLGIGTYGADIQVTSPTLPSQNPPIVHVNLQVVPKVNQVFLPALRR